MEFQTLRKSHKKKIIIGASVFVAIAGVLIVRSSFAKYQTVKSFKIVDGVINYTYNPADFEMIAMYQQKEGSTCTTDSCYDSIDKMPTTNNYVINESKSYCNVNGTKDTGAVLKTIDGNHIISALQKGSKCYLYFDKGSGKAIDTILANVTEKDGTPDFSKTAETDEGVYKAVDESGKDSYYFRGASSNNYVKFANKYWRIVRINGDGSIRLIYDGTSVHENGKSNTDSIAVSDVKFSHKDASSSDYVKDNTYVGFMYGTAGSSTYEATHKNTNKSYVLQQLETWYSNNIGNNTAYSSKLDLKAGFCGDRTLSEGTGVGTTTTEYGAYKRLVDNKAPELTCNKVDYYTVEETTRGNGALTYPIGLISADEVAMAGGVYYTTNKNYYLYNGQDYWTLSPSNCYGAAFVFYVHSDGYIYNDPASRVFVSRGVRPVINMKADTTFTFNGTGEKGSMTNPYIVE